MRGLLSRGRKRATGREIRYELWDVFTLTPFTGNPLAVVPDAEGLAGEDMQRVARELNLSETSFVLPSQRADVRARFFTPARELPMAGHPSVGTVYALEHLGRLKPEGVILTLELGVGLVKMGLERRNGRLERVWMNQGVPELGEVVEDRAGVAAALGLTVADLKANLPIQIGSAGVPFLYVPVVSLEALGRAKLNLAVLSDFMADEHRAVFLFTRFNDGADIRARMLGEALGVVEDPATGSAHGPLGAYLATHGVLSLQEGGATFVSRQGVEMGRPSRIEVSVQAVDMGNSDLESSGFKDAGFEVYVGGSAVRVGEGKLYL